MKRILVTTLLGLSLSVSTCFAGDVKGILLSTTGKVMVNSGHGFSLATAKTAVRLGDEIFVGESANATVRFEGADCVINLAPAFVTRITGPAMCQQVATPVASASALRASDDGVVITPVNGTFLPPAPGIISPYVIAGGIFAANAAAFASSVMQKNPPPVSAP